MVRTTPVIGYDVHGLKDSIQNGVTGLLAKENDIIDMADKIAVLLENRELREKLGKNA
ncbi:MAG: glycosyltransferase, partial [Thermoplasmata archaeon]